MLRIVAFPMLFTFLFSMACMGQTFQYSRGWTNGKRAGAATTLNNLFYRDNDVLSELFEVPDTNGRRLEKCLLQLQRFIRNPLNLHSSTDGALAINPSSIPANQNGIGNGNGNSNSNSNSIRNSNNNINSNPYGRNHQSSELFEELGVGGSGIIDTNAYEKH